MRSICPVCGKKFWCDYPNLWAYKIGSLYICSWKCLRARRKEAEENMEKLKKDGTPAKRPGPKPKNTEAPEGERVDLVEVPEESQIRAPELPERTYDFENWPKLEYKITGIDTAVGAFQYFKSNQYLDWSLNGETISMNLEEWREFMKIFPDVLMVLEIDPL